MRAAAVPAGQSETVYVDFLSPSHLEAILSTLTQALRARPGELWPSILVRPSAAAGPVIASAVRPRLVLVPLERLGSSQGLSGASVLIGYFMDEGNTYLPSKPLVIKLDRQSKLEQEYVNSRSWPRHPYAEDGRFAHPLWLRRSSRSTDVGVLVAPFSSEGALNNQQTGWQLHLRDYWHLLTSPKPTSTAQLIRHFHDLYELIHQVHRDGRVTCVRQPVSLSTEYQRYIRGLMTGHASVPQLIFGTEQRTSMYGETWPNPISVVRRILDMDPIDAACGPIHGDLHPKNVVLDRNLHANVIDFGWAQPLGHISKDYALMEANLRSMTLPSHVPFEDMKALANSLVPGDRTEVADAQIRLRQRLITTCIWPRVRRHSVSASWEVEYLAPLLLISFGLIKHLDSARNQQSLILSVLALARHLDAWFAQ